MPCPIPLSRRCRFIALLAVVVLGLTACGDGETAAPSAVSSPTPSESAFPYAGTTPGLEVSPSEALGSLAGPEIACEPTGTELPASTTVNVTISDGEIDVDTDEIPAGIVRFNVENAGEEPHEMLLVFSADAGSLPVDDDGGVDESLITENTVRGEVPMFPAGETCPGVFDLPPGEYVVFCNVVEPAGQPNESHFESGEWAELTVVRASTASAHLDRTHEKHRTSL